MGTEAFWVPAALAAVGAGTNYVNEKQANKKQQASETQAILNQSEERAKANSQVKGLVDQIAGNSPAQIAAKSTGEYVSQLRKNAAGSTQGGPTAGTSSLAPAVGASSRYAAGTADSQREVEDYGNKYAGQLGELDAATRQRQNEGLGMQTLGTNLNTIGLESYGQNFVDQLRAQAAGQANPFVSLMANLVGGAGNAVSLNPDGYFKPKSSVTPAKNYGRFGGSDYTAAPLGDMAGVFA